MQWCEEHENLLKEWAEKARFYSWMHHKTSAKYNKLNNMMTIPMIIVSIVNGSINFTLVGNNSSSKTVTLIIPLLVGTLNIVTAVLSSLTKFFKTAEMVEKHEMFHRQFNILVRNISLELSLPPSQRKPPTESLNLSRYDLDRLVNEAPRIPAAVILEFNKQFPYKQNKPEIANFFNKINIHGRNKIREQNADRFMRIRTFYKWKVARHMRLLNESANRPFRHSWNSIFTSKLPLDYIPNPEKKTSFEVYYNTVSSPESTDEPRSFESVRIDVDDAK